ncbi:MAG TPA: DUF5916 domain-containing protein [Blastocatellia bacterium]|nr:DUF5916 domain-containing protein [Blastocatellia bacterium]
MLTRSYRMMHIGQRLLLMLVGLLSLLSSSARCQSAEGPRQNTRSISTARVDHAPALDGTLQDPLWQQAASIVEFHQREPFEKERATENTEVKVLYDRRFLYFGIQCFDRDHKGIVATELRRDADFSVDDNFTILLSPRNDKRNAYTFTVNPLGTQFDALISDEGRVNDPNWDGIWRSNAQVTSDGWTATIAIPFSTLNFKTSDNVTVGINFRRFIRRKNEEDLWQSYLRIYGIERVSESGELTDLKEIGSGRLLIIKPYLLGGVKSDSQAGTKALHTGGLDIKYGLRSNLVANLTVNTDFADADVDPVQFNITPFKIFIPEKRPFFLENSGVFQFGSENNQLFFSRQVGIDPLSGQQVPLDVGAKLTGSIGDYDVGVLDAKTRSSGPNPFANYFVARVKRKILSESYIGGIYIDKESGNTQDSFNRSAGLDGSFILFKKLTLSAYFAKTFAFDPQLRGKDWSDYFGASYRSNLVQANFFHSTVQPNFNPEVGFVDRTDIITNFVEVQLAPRPKHGPVREYNFLGFYSRQPDTHGVLQTQEWQTTFRANFHNGAYTDDDLFDNFIQRLSSPFNIFKNVFIPAGIYHFDRHQFTYGSDRSKRFFYSFFERFGTFYNGRLNEFRVRTSYRPTAKISLAAVETWDRFRFGNGIFNVHIGSINTSYSFNRFLTTSFLVQVNSIEKNPVSANFRLRYNYRPDSDLFIIYNIGSQFNSIAAGNPVLSREQRFTVKYTYSFFK